MDPDSKHFKIHFNDNPHSDLSTKLETSVLKLLEFLSLPAGSISLSLVSPDEIQSINLNHRNIDKVTDVLSFPQLQFSKPYNSNVSFENQLTESSESNVNVESEVAYGDIILCPEQAKANAKKIGHSKFNEMRFLLVHSLLHLLGYDHIEDNDEVLMIAEQKRILKSLGWNQYSAQPQDHGTPAEREAQ